MRALTRDKLDKLACDLINSGWEIVSRWDEPTVPEGTIPVVMMAQQGALVLEVSSRGEWTLSAVLASGINAPRRLMQALERMEIQVDDQWEGSD